MVKIHCCLAIILSEKGLQLSSWGEQFRCLNTDVQRHNRWFRLAQIPAPGWQVWCRSYGRYTPFSGGAARAQAGCYTVLKRSQLISDTWIIPAACPGNTMPSRRRLRLCSSAERISKFAPYIVKGQKWIITWWYRNQHFSVYTDIPTFARTNISMFVL